MIKQNLHTHSNFCDGRCTLEEMILSAIQKGYHSIGFSSHIKTVFPTICLQDKQEYFNQLYHLREKYADKIKIYIGGEFDLYSDDSVLDYDYTIGSVHFDLIDGEVVFYDYNYERAKYCVDKYFGGDGVKYAKKYYECVKRLPDTFDFDIVGHLDVITKFDEKHNLIDETDPEYIQSALDALHYLVNKGKKIFEINYGSITRGHKTHPYPAPFLLKEMINLGCEFVLTSDAHHGDHLLTDTDLEKIYPYLKKLGIDHLLVFDGKKFLPQKI